MRSPNSFHGCFVTGTDTGVGKTRVSAAILHVLGGAGWIAAGFKPVAAGSTLIAGELVNEDVRALRDASSASVSDVEVGPCQFDTACAPHIAADIEGRSIDRHAILEAARSLQRRTDCLVVEGVGGFCVSLGSDWDTTHLACALGLPVVLVVGLRLGCLNHALLTAEAIRARHLRLVGWIANAMDPAMPMRDENIVTLRRELSRRHQVQCLGVVPWLPAPDSRLVAEHLNRASLLSSLDLHHDASTYLSRKTA